ncbi:MAG: hypothetical protein AB8C13_06035 [Phycisphaerales bacterium]
MELLFGPILNSQTIAGTELESIINSLGHNLVPALLFSALGVVAVIGIVFGTINSTAKKKESEKTKRELAAYVAEGSISPEDAERILRADESTKS